MGRRVVQSVAARHSPTRAAPSGLTENQRQVSELLDVVQTPPPRVEPTYVDACVRAAARVGDPVETSLATSLRSGGSAAALRDLALEARGRVLDALSEGARDVLGVLSEMNDRRRGFERVDLPAPLCDFVCSRVSSLGALRSDDPTVPLPQISSARMSFEGFGGTGDVEADVARLVPDASEVGRRKLEELMSLLDFSRRVPRIVLTCDYAPDGENRGSIVVWRRMPDASGYVLSRRNVVDGSVVNFELVNSDLETSTRSLSEYIGTWALSFYDRIAPDTLHSFLDTTVEPNCYYHYTLQGVRTSRSRVGSVFAVDVAPAVGSPAQRAELKKKMEELDPGLGPDTISPYPLLAQHFLGDSRYDWVLAGVNSRFSLSRKDPRSTTRSFSYLTAQMDFLLDQISRKRFMVPRDVGKVIENVSDSIVDFGISQTLDALLEETGVLYFFDGRDVGEEVVLGRIDRETPRIIESVLSAVDPETAVVDITALSENISTLLDSTQALSKRGIEAALNASDMEVADPTSGDDAAGGDPPATADLMTFDGVSLLIRAIRVLVDLSADSRTGVIVDPVRPRLPTRPTRPTPTRPPVVANPPSTPPRPSTRPPQGPTSPRNNPSDPRDVNQN